MGNLLTVLILFFHKKKDWETNPFSYPCPAYCGAFDLFIAVFFLFLIYIGKCIGNFGIFCRQLHLFPVIRNHRRSNLDILIDFSRHLKRRIDTAMGTVRLVDFPAELIPPPGRIMNADITWERDPARIRPSKSEVFRLCGDNTKIKNLTGWSPQVSLEEGLRRTVEWFTTPGNLAGYKTGIYNV